MQPQLPATDDVGLPKARETRILASLLTILCDFYNLMCARSAYKEHLVINASQFMRHLCVLLAGAAF